MDSSPKVQRPAFGRSKTATASLSPPKAKVESKPTQKPSGSKLHLPSLHPTHALHRHRHDHKETRSATQSAINIATPHHFSDLAKIAVKPPGTKSDNNANGQEKAEGADVADAPNRSECLQELALERERRDQRNQELRSSLNALSEMAQDSTSQIDHAYYMLLEKVTALQSTIRNLEELTAATTSLQNQFEADVKEVESNIQTQIDNLKSFSPQQSRIEELESRVKAGMDKAKGLSERLQSARGRVEEWELQEKKFQATASMRIRIGWACVGVFASLLLAILVLKYFIPGDSTSLVNEDTGKGFPWNETWRAAAMELFQSKDRTEPAIAPQDPKAQASFQNIDPRLRIFDEL